MSHFETIEGKLNDTVPRQELRSQYRGDALTKEELKSSPNAKSTAPFDEEILHHLEAGQHAIADAIFDEVIQEAEDNTEEDEVEDTDSEY
ncbi:hypothetical protein MMC16_006222 [Acarospora aff. strigata]|nr:hypothetical protein [Acarospora aff. strigata]